VGEGVRADTVFACYSKRQSSSARHIINRDPVSREKHTIYAIKKYLKHTTRTSNYISTPLPPPSKHAHTHTHTLQRDGRLNIILYSNIAILYSDSYGETIEWRKSSSNVTLCPKNLWTYMKLPPPKFRIWVYSELDDLQLTKLDLQLFVIIWWYFARLVINYS